MPPDGEDIARFDMTNPFQKNESPLAQDSACCATTATQLENRFSVESNAVESELPHPEEDRRRPPHDHRCPTEKMLYRQVIRPFAERLSRAPLLRSFRLFRS